MSNQVKTVAEGRVALGAGASAVKIARELRQASVPRQAIRELLCEFMEERLVEPVLQVSAFDGTAQAPKLAPESAALVAMLQASIGVNPSPDVRAAVVSYLTRHVSQRTVAQVIHYAFGIGYASALSEVRASDEGVDEALIRTVEQTLAALGWRAP